MKRFFLTLLLLCGCASVFGAAKTETRLLLSADAARPGQTVWAGIQLKMPPGWHTYWRNSGDSGIPTEIEWTLPAGVKAGEPLWPVPEKLATPAGDMTFITYDYNDVTVLTVPLQLSKDLPPGPLVVKAKVSWQECQEICILGRADLEKTLSIGTTSRPSADAALIETWRNKAPRPEPAPQARAYWEGDPGTNDSRPLIIEWDRKATSPDFFPYADQNFEVQTATAVSNAPGKIFLTKTVKKISGNWPQSVRGVLVLDGQGIEVTLPIGSPRSGGSAERRTLDFKESAALSRGAATVFYMVLFAFLGGLILNVMPCVLPVISLKVLAFVGQSKETPGRLRNLGLVYGLGVLASFAALAVLSIIVQRAGGLADWGAAFRNPQFRIIITVLITLVALNLFGVFEVNPGAQVMGSASGLASRHGYSGAFFNGVLATVLATPCTAPFLGGAIAFAFTQPPLINLLIFLSAGIGLALPFVLVCLRPSLLAWLPKPGVWMEQFKVGVGFAMLATAIWLFWLTATRIGKDGVLWLGLFLVVLSFAAWLWGQFVQRGKRHVLAIVIIALVALFDYTYILEGKLHWRNYAAETSADQIAWQKWSPEAVAKARSEGHPVLVDFTADSCLNCQVNKLTSLEIPATRAKLKALNAVAFIADYTDENPLIAKELARFHRSGVPMVLVYPSRPEAEAILLPTVLTPALVQNALDQASAAPVAVK